MTPRSVAVVLGRFLPVHQGHLFLLSTARRASDALLVVVRASPGDPFSPALRARWLAQLAPTPACVTLVGDERPAPGPDDFGGWAALTLARLPPAFAGASLRVFAGEERGASLARAMGAEFSLVRRDIVPISGSQVRASPGRHRAFLPVPVQMHLCARGML